MNVLLALDQNVEEQLNEQRDRIEALLEQLADAYRVKAELEAARDLRQAMGAKVDAPGGDAMLVAKSLSDVRIIGNG